VNAGRSDRSRPGGAPATRRAAWAWGEARLCRAGLPKADARFEAEVLLRSAAGIGREELLVRPDAMLGTAVAERYARWIDRRAAGRPTAYLVGRREFFGIEFRVDDRVLIPRPETERLVEVVCGALESRIAPLVADIGTGSGAIAVALAHTLPRLRAVATDVSTEALAVARQNAARVGVAERISWAEGAGVEPLRRVVREGALDALVSNPPYIPTADVADLPLEIRAHEPAVALDGGPDGLRVHREVIAASCFLRPGGMLALEVSALGGQAQAVAALITADGHYGAPSVIRDYSGAERVVLAQRSCDDADHRY
jgi:release factor glutamine methyltransferase